jgi:hypothetical protein
MNDAIDPRRPSLTREEVSALTVGDQIRNIRGDLFHVIGIVDATGFGGGDVAVLARWLRHKGWWSYSAADFNELNILYTPK